MMHITLIIPPQLHSNYIPNSISFPPILLINQWTIQAAMMPPGKCGAIQECNEGVEEEYVDMVVGK